MSIEGHGHFLPYIFQVLYVLCFTRPRYQVSVYRTIGPLVCFLKFIIEVEIGQLDFLLDNSTAMQIVNSKLKYLNMIISDVFLVLVQ